MTTSTLIPVRWATYTNCRERAHVQLSTPSWQANPLADVAEILARKLNDGAGEYPDDWVLEAHCTACGRHQSFELQIIEGWDEEDEGLTWRGIDDALEPWLREHDPCPFQGRLL